MKKIVCLLLFAIGISACMCLTCSSCITWKSNSSFSVDTLSAKNLHYHSSDSLNIKTPKK